MNWNWNWNWMAWYFIMKSANVATIRCSSFVEIVSEWRAIHCILSNQNFKLSFGQHEVSIPRKSTSTNLQSKFKNIFSIISATIRFNPLNSFSRLFAFNYKAQALEVITISVLPRVSTKEIHCSKAPPTLFNWFTPFSFIFFSAIWKSA